MQQSKHTERMVSENLLYDFLCLSFILVINNCLNELIVLIKHLPQTQLPWCHCMGFCMQSKQDLLKVFNSLTNFDYFALQSINIRTRLTTKTFSTEIIAKKSMKFA